MHGIGKEGTKIGSGDGAVESKGSVTALTVETAGPFHFSMADFRCFLFKCPYKYWLFLPNQFVSNDAL